MGSNRVWLQKQMEIQTLNYELIPRKLLLVSEQTLHFLITQTFLFCFPCVAVSTLLPNTRVAIFPDKHIWRRSITFIITLGRILDDWIYSILAQTGNPYLYFLNQFLH